MILFSSFATVLSLLLPNLYFLLHLTTFSQLNEGLNLSLGFFFFLMINMLCGMRMAIHKFLEGGDCILFFILPVLTWCLVAWCLVFSDKDHSVQFSRSVVSDFLRPHESQHARPPCPSPTPGVHSDSTSIESLVLPYS